MRRGAIVVANVAAEPWATIWLDGRHVGETPQAGLPLRSGERVLELRGPGGATNTVRVRLRR